MGFFFQLKDDKILCTLGNKQICLIISVVHQVGLSGPWDGAPQLTAHTVLSPSLLEHRPPHPRHLLTSQLTDGNQEHNAEYCTQVGGREDLTDTQHFLLWDDLWMALSNQRLCTWSKNNVVFIIALWLLYKIKTLFTRYQYVMEPWDRRLISNVPGERHRHSGHFHSPFPSHSYLRKELDSPSDAAHGGRGQCWEALWSDNNCLSMTSYLDMYG